MPKRETVKCYCGNLDGIHQGLVIAHSQKEACEIIGISMSGFRTFWGTANKWPEGHFKVGVLYRKKYHSDDEWEARDA